MIVFLHALIWLLASVVFIVRYKRNPQGFYLNYLFYLLFFGLFYISLPSIISLLTSFSHVGASVDTISITAVIGLYFVTVFLIGYTISKDKNVSINSVNIHRFKSLLFIIRFLATILSVYIAYVVMLNFQHIMSVPDVRGVKSNLYTLLDSQYKIMAIFSFHVLLVIYLFFQLKKLKYVLFLSPYVLLELLLSGRTYIFLVFFLFFIFSILKNKILSIKFVAIILLAIVGIGVLRVPGDFQMEYLLLIFYEFIFTWTTVHLVFESGLTQGFSDSVVYGVMRFFPSFFYSYIFGEYMSYTKISGDANPLGWGIGGSIVAEAISYKNTLIIFLYPVVIVAYGFSMNWLLRMNYVTGKIIFVLAILQIQQLFRYSFSEFALYPFYMVFFLGFYIIATDLYYLATVKDRKTIIISREVK